MVRVYITFTPLYTTLNSVVLKAIRVTKRAEYAARTTYPTFGWCIDLLQRKTCDEVVT